MIKALFALAFIHFWLYVIWTIFKSKTTAEQKLNLLKTIGGISIFSVISVTILTVFVFLF